MTSRFEALPLEIVLDLVDHHGLERTDMLQLRRVSRTLCAKLTGPRFYDFLREPKHIDLSVEALEPLTTKTANRKGATAAVQNVSIVGLATQGVIRRAGEGTPDPRDEEKRLLTEVFRGLVSDRGDEPLESLTLRVMVIRTKEIKDHPVGERCVPIQENDPDVRPFRSYLKFPHMSRAGFQCAVDTFLAVMGALQASRLRIRRLNVFRDDDMEQCGLPRRVLSHVDWDDPAMAHALGALTGLSVSLCCGLYAGYLAPVGGWRSQSPSRTPEEDEDNDGLDWLPRSKQAVEDLSPDDDEVSGVASIVRLCPHLRDLDLHYIHGGQPRNGYASERIMQAAVRATRTQPVSLDALRVGGLSVFTDDLMELLRTARPHRVTLLNTTLHGRGDSAESLVDYLTSREAAVDYIHMDNIRVVDAGQWHRTTFMAHPSRRTWLTDRTIVREGAATKDAIVLGTDKVRRYPDGPSKRAWIGARFQAFGWC